MVVCPRGTTLWLLETFPDGIAPMLGAVTGRCVHMPGILAGAKDTMLQYDNSTAVSGRSIKRVSRAKEGRSPCSVSVSLLCCKVGGGSASKRRPLRCPLANDD